MSGPRPAVPGRKAAKAFVARVRTITFKTDHRDAAGAKLLKGAVDAPVKFKNHEGRVARFGSKVSENGAVTLQKPDWSLTIPRNDPISHTMGEVVKIDVEILIKKVPNGSATLDRIFGEASSGAVALSFDVGMSRVVKDGDVVTLTDVISTGRLPAIVGILQESVRWKAVIDGGAAVTIGVSGPHKIFMTLGQPIGKAALPTPNVFVETGDDQAITIPRLEFAVGGAKGADTERGAADRMFQFISGLGVGYVLGFNPAPPGKKDTTGIDPPTSLHHYLWLCNGNQAEGECHVIAAAFRLALRVIGVTGAMDVGFMRPHPGRQEHEPDFPRRLENIKGRLNVTATRKGVFRLVFLDHKNDANNFEGVIKFGNALYAIGDSIFDRFSAPAGGISMDDLNSTDYFTDREIVFPRSKILDEKKGAFELKYVDSAGRDAPIQYPWKTVTGAPPSKLLPGQDVKPFRWED